MWFTGAEIILIADGNKNLTVRCFTKAGNMPIKVGSKTYLKTGSFCSKERYGQIQITNAVIKPLSQMSDKEAQQGGYSSKEAYIDDQINSYNIGVNKDTIMIFYEFKVISINYDLVKSLTGVKK